MKKAVFHSILALVLVLGLTLAIALPVMAQDAVTGGKSAVWEPTDGHPEGVYLVGQTIVYELYIDNDHPEASANIQWIQDRFGVEYNGDWRLGASEYWWNDDDEIWVAADPVESVNIPVDSSWTEQFSHLIHEDHLIDHEGVKKVVNQILALGTQGLEDVVIDQTYPVRVIQPSIELEKTATPSVAQVGQIVTYEFTITNTGDWPLVIISLIDDELGDLPVALVLGPGAAAGVTHPYTIQDGDLPLTNTATVTAIAEGFDQELFGPGASPTAMVEDTASAMVTALHPVGGTASPVSRLALLVPWIVLAGLIAGAAVFVWSRRAQGRA